ncbi:alpha-xenorhabdolysin family binary toxin subunit A [Pseudomonas sp. 18173]|uniref:alpha-xenorhabdolysin family binary toxin subunit A n=1 Tax=Pseudomonas sp. 18173 TaxID=3390055 RepID=UPI003D1AB284
MNMEDIEIYNLINDESAHSSNGMNFGPRLDSADQPRLVVTSEQLLEIKQYVRLGRALPTARDEIEKSLGGVIDHPNFKWLDIQDLNVKVKDHATGWSSIENGLIQVGGGLSGLAKDLVEFSQNLMHDIEQMPIVERLKPYNDLEVENAPFMAFDQSDAAIHAQLGLVFEDLKKSVVVARKPTLDLKVEIDNFNRVLNDKLIPLVGEKVARLDTIDFAIDLEKFRAELDRVEKSINQTNKELVKHGAMQVLSGFNTLALLLNALFSSPEEAILGKAFLECQEKLDGFMREKQRLLSLIGGQEKLPGLILSHSKSLDNLAAHMGAAARASNALVLVWNSVVAEIDRSATEFALIEDGVSLIRFKQSFNRGISPWNEVRHMADELLISLKKAIKDFNEQGFLQEEGVV